MSEQVACKQCGGLMLPTTAKRTGGLCMPCHKRQQQAAQADPKTLMLEELESKQVYSAADLAQMRWLDGRRNNFAFTSDTRFELGALDEFAQFRYLKFLHFSGCLLSDADIAVLAKIKTLKRLSLENCPLADRSVAHLLALDRLEDLWLENTPIGDRALDHIARMTHLSEGLNLAGTKITDAGLTKLAGLIKLKHVWVRRTAVTDAGILALAGIPRLTIFAYAPKGPGGEDDSRVTATGMEAFIKAQRERAKRPAAGKSAPSLPAAGPDPDDVQAARAALFEFFAAMTQWELDWQLLDRKREGRTIPAPLAKVARDRTEAQLGLELKRLMSTHCTQRERVYFVRSNGEFQTPPSYDRADQVRFTNIEQPAKRKLAFYTDEWGDSRHQFVMVKKGDRWLLDQNNVWLDGWGPWTI